MFESYTVFVACFQYLKAPLRFRDVRLKISWCRRRSLKNRAREISRQKRNILVSFWVFNTFWKAKPWLLSKSDISKWKHDSWKIKVPTGNMDYSEFDCTRCCQNVSDASVAVRQHRNAAWRCVVSLSLLRIVKKMLHLLPNIDGFGWIPGPGAYQMKKWIRPTSTIAP